MTFTVTAKREVPDEYVDNLIVNLLDCGGDYAPYIAKVRLRKAGGKREGFSTGDTNLLEFLKVTGNAMCFLVIDPDDDDVKPEWKDVTFITLGNALQLMAEKYPHHFNDMMVENDDIITADVFMQLCLFKEVVYG